ncbi:MAG: glycerol kinase GlpK [Prevotella sp.]|nr:glycerol kinase GlpK [Prevotella sp.]
MINKIIAIDQSTSSTKAMLFDEQCRMTDRCNIDHQQYYPQAGWVEHDAEEIYDNMVKAIGQLLKQANSPVDTAFSLAITNQRETVVVWDKETGHPVYRALVWQDNRGAALCAQLRQQGATDMVLSRSGLLIDPNFSATEVRWILDHVDGAREAADKGKLLMGTIETWLIWKLTGGRSFYTDTTNASRTMLFNIHTMQWDEELLRLFDIPRSMLPEVLPCDAVFGETTVEGLFSEPIPIAGVLGDSHGALVGQMCFTEGSGKVTYGTGSSVMVNIGEKPLAAPNGLVTSVGYSAFGRHYYGYEGNIYSTGATLKWIADQLKLVAHPSEMEAEATTVDSTGGVYIIPAFAGLGAPWWQPDAKAAVVGMTFATTRAHFLRAALESIAYQVRDLIGVMAKATGGQLREICADGGPTRNKFLMQFQADQLATPVVCTEVEDASAMGAVVMNGFARGVWTTTDEVVGLRKVTQVYEPHHTPEMDTLYEGWRKAVLKSYIK